MRVPACIWRGLLVFLALAAAGNAQALSCMQRQLTYYGFCEKEVCTRGVAVEQLQAHFACSIRNEVRDVDPWMLDLMSEELQRLQAGQGGMIVRLSGRERYYLDAATPRSREEYLEAAKAGRYSYDEKPMRLVIWDRQATSADLDQIRSKEQAIARVQWWSDKAMFVADWGALIGAVLLTLGTGWRYTQHIRSGSRAGKNRCLLYQCSIFGAALVLLLSAHPFPLFVLVLPLLLLTWLRQIVLTVYYRYRGSAAVPPNSLI